MAAKHVILLVRGRVCARGPGTRVFTTTPVATGRTCRELTPYPPPLPPWSTRCVVTASGDSWHSANPWGQVHHGDRCGHSLNQLASNGSSYTVRLPQEGACRKRVLARCP